MAIVTKTVNANDTVLLAIKGNKEYLLCDTSGVPQSGGYTTPISPATDCYANYTPLSDVEIDIETSQELLAANGYRFWGIREKRKK